MPTYGSADLRESRSALRATIEGIGRALEAFPDLGRPDRTLAFSGGKDSIALAFALKSMGMPVRLRAVDMGYSKHWLQRIVDLAEHLALPLEVLEVASIIVDQAVDGDARRDLALRRTFLDNSVATIPTATPCTNCYNCKILSLVHGGARSSEVIFFAHHATDVLASFLKSAIMFHDRWAEENPVFDRHRFRTLGQRVAVDLRSENSAYLGIFRNYLMDGLAHTTEPPVERRALHGAGYIIGRPLFFISEQTTAKLSIDVELRAEKSGCGHSLASSTRTPREIVHYELLPFIEETAEGRGNLRELLASIGGRLNVDGTASADIRAARHRLLGVEYKGGPEQLADRL